MTVSSSGGGSSKGGGGSSSVSSAFTPIGGGGSGIGTGGVGSTVGGQSTVSTTTTTTGGGKGGTSGASGTGSAGGRGGVGGYSPATTPTPVATSIHGGVITANLINTSGGKTGGGGTGGGTPVASSVSGGVITANIITGSSSTQPSQAQITAQSILQQQNKSVNQGMGLVEVGKNVYLTQQAYEVSQRMNPQGVKQVIANAERIAQAQNVAIVLGYDPNRGILSTDVASRVPVSAIEKKELIVEEKRVTTGKETYVKSTLKQNENVVGTYYEKQGIGGMSIRPEVYEAKEKLTTWGMSFIPAQQLSQAQANLTQQSQVSTQQSPKTVENRFYTPKYTNIVAEITPEQTVKITGVEPKSGNVETIFMGTFKELQQKYPAIAKDVMRSDAYLYSTSIQTISGWSEGIPIISGTVRGATETAGIFGKTFTDVVKGLYGYGEKYQTVSDVRIKYSGLEKAASFTDIGYTFGYSAPFIASSFVGTPARLVSLGKNVGAVIELGKSVATTTAVSTGLSFTFNVYESIMNKQSLDLGKVASDAYKFNVLTPVIAPVAGTSANIASAIIKPSSVFRYTLSTTMTGAVAGATAGPFVHEAFTGSSKGKEVSAVYGGILGGTIGALYGGYTVYTSKTLDSGLIGKVRVGEITKDTQSTAVLQKPYTTSRAVEAGATFDVSTNVKLGNFRIVADPLSESVGVAVGKDVSTSTFYGISRGRLQKMPYVTTLDYGNRIATLPLTKQTTIDFIQALESRKALSAAKELRTKSERTTSAYTEILHTGKYTRGKETIDVYGVDMAAKLVKAKGSEFSKTTAEKFLNEIRGRAGLYGRSTLEGQMTKDIDIMVYGTFNKQQAKQYLVEKAKKAGVSVKEKEGTLYIGNIKFDVHSPFEGVSVYGGSKSDLLAFGTKKQPVLVKTKYADIVNPAQTIATKASTSSYVYGKGLITEQRRQKDVLQLRDILGLSEQKKSKKESSVYQISSSSSVSKSIKLRPFLSDSKASSQQSKQPSASIVSGKSVSIVSGSSVSKTPSSFSKSDSRYDFNSFYKSYSSYRNIDGSSIRFPPSKPPWTKIPPTESPPSKPPKKPDSSLVPSGDYLRKPPRPEDPFGGISGSSTSVPPTPFFQPPGAAGSGKGKLSIMQPKKYIPSLISIVKGIKSPKQPKLSELTPYDVRPVVVDSKLKKKPRWF